MQCLPLVQCQLEAELLYFLLPSSCSHRKKTLQINLSWVLYSCNLPVLGWAPKLRAELEGSLGTEPRSEEWMGSLEEGGLRLLKIVPKLAFHQAGKRQLPCALWTCIATTISLGSLVRFMQPLAAFGRTTSLHEVRGRCPYGLELIATILLLQGRQKYLCPRFSESVLKPLHALLHAVVAECLAYLAAISTVTMPIQSEEQHFVDGSGNYGGQNRAMQVVLTGAARTNQQNDSFCRKRGKRVLFHVKKQITKALNCTFWSLHLVCSGENRIIYVLASKK